MVKFLSGKKSYLIAAAYAFATFAFAVGLIDKQTYDLIQGILIPSGIASLRAGMQKGAK